MNRDFIRIQSLSGELKRSRKKKNTGVTISTEELVFQQPHVNYHILMRHIVSIVPVQSEVDTHYTMEWHRKRAREVTEVAARHTEKRYKIFVREAIIHNRSGRRSIGPVQFVMPIQQDMLDEIANFAGLHALQ